MRRNVHQEMSRTVRVSSEVHGVLQDVAGHQGCQESLALQGKKDHQAMTAAACKDPRALMEFLDLSVHGVFQVNGAHRDRLATRGFHSMRGRRSSPCTPRLIS